MLLPFRSCACVVLVTTAANAVPCLRQTDTSLPPFRRPSVSSAAVGPVDHARWCRAGGGVRKIATLPCHTLFFSSGSIVDCGRRHGLVRAVDLSSAASVLSTSFLLSSLSSPGTSTPMVHDEKGRLPFFKAAWQERPHGADVPSGWKRCSTGACRPNSAFHEKGQCGEAKCVRHKLCGVTGLQGHQYGDKTYVMDRWYLEYDGLLPEACKGELDEPDFLRIRMKDDTDKNLFDDTQSFSAAAS